jgi:hypothetical protein
MVDESPGQINTRNQALASAGSAHVSGSTRDRALLFVSGLMCICLIGLVLMGLIGNEKSEHVSSVLNTLADVLKVLAGALAGILYTRPERSH